MIAFVLAVCLGSFFFGAVVGGLATVYALKHRFEASIKKAIRERGR